jgi:DNA-directed RNA polymerase subunit RPC12/RpoP
MATTNITVRHRPNRIAFLVRPGELSDLERAASICTLLWGGIRNPIIPVSTKDDANADTLLGNFQVDVLFPVAESDAIKSFLERYPYLMNPRLSARELFYPDWHTKKNKVAYLDVLNAVEKFWDKEFKHAPKDIESACQLVAWHDSDPLKEVFTLSFGAYPATLNLMEDFRESFLRGLRAKEIMISASGSVDAGLVHGITPMRLTGVDLRGFQGSFRTWSGGVYFGDAKSFADLVTFWNLRAAGTAMEFASLSDLTRFEDFTRAHLKVLDEQPNRHPNVESHIAVCYRDHQDEVLAALQKFPTTKRTLLCQCDDSFCGHFTAEPVMFAFDLDFALGLVEKEAGRYTVTLTLADKKFLVDSQRSLDDQSLGVSLEPHTSFGYPNHTLSPPYRRELSEFYSRKISFDPWRVRSEPEGIAVFITAGEKTLPLFPIPNTAVIEALLGQAGLKTEPSPGGRLADRLLEKLDGLEGVRVFKIRGVRQLVASLTSQDAVGRGDATNAIWNGGQFRDHERLYIEPRDTERLDTGATFDFLLKNEFFRAGLELKCDNCGLASWLSLRQIDDGWICEYCGHRNLTSLHIRDRGDWRFRKSGLLTKDNNQEGAIPVLLSLLVLQRVLQREGVLRMTSANMIEGVPPCEIDFMVVEHRRGEINWGLGEAKSAGGEIDAKDVENMKSVADKLKKIGAHTYLIFAKTAESFTQKEIELFAATRKEGYPVILFTNKEIEPYNPYYDGDEQEQLPHRYVHSFDEMVRNSEFRYLRPKPATGDTVSTGA